MNITNLSSSQLRKAADLKEKIAGLEKDLAALLGSSAPASTPTTKPAKKGGMSAAGKAKIVAAQKLRWAKVKAAKSQAPKTPKPAATIASKVIAKIAVKPVPAKPAIVKPAKKKWKISAAGLAKIKAANKAYWAKKKAAKKA
jgi:hypothetical protein